MIQFRSSFFCKLGFFLSHSKQNHLKIIDSVATVNDQMCNLSEILGLDLEPFKNLISFLWNFIAYEISKDFVKQFSNYYLQKNINHTPIPWIAHIWVSKNQISGTVLMIQLTLNSPTCACIGQNLCKCKPRQWKSHYPLGVQEVPAFRDFWYQKGIMKFETLFSAKSQIGS